MTQQLNSAQRCLASYRNLALKLGPNQGIYSWDLLIFFVVELVVNFGVFCWCCCQTPVLGLGLKVNFTFSWNNNDINDKNNDKNNPHQKFVKWTLLGDKDQGVGIRDKGLGSELAPKSNQIDFVETWSVWSLFLVLFGPEFVWSLTLDSWNCEWEGPMQLI